MTGIDHALVRQVQKLIDGSNVHCIEAWLFVYETAPPESEKRIMYERYLREFVSSHTIIRAAFIRAEKERNPFPFS